MTARYVIKRFLLLVLALVVLGACNKYKWMPPPVPGTTTPLPVTLESLLLDDDELPVGWWNDFVQRESVREKWQISGAVDAIMGYSNNNRGGSITHTIVRMADSDDAEITWQSRRDDRIEAAFTSFNVIQLLSDDDLPKLNADQILLRCEHYTRDVKGCVVRLRYGLIYTEVKGDFTNDEISATEFHQFLEAIDEKMKPIWSGSNQEYSPLAVP